MTVEGGEDDILSWSTYAAHGLGARISPKRGANHLLVEGRGHYGIFFRVAGAASFIRRSGTHCKGTGSW